MPTITDITKPNAPGNMGTLKRQYLVDWPVADPYTFQTTIPHDLGFEPDFVCITPATTPGLGNIQEYMVGLDITKIMMGGLPWDAVAVYLARGLQMNHKVVVEVYGHHSVER
jgi:hypothetical protein